MSDHQDDHNTTSKPQSNTSLPSDMESLFLDDASRNVEIHHTIELDEFEEEWELYPTLANQPLSSSRSGVDVPSAFARPDGVPLDKDTEDRLKETFQALSTMELDVFVEGSLDEFEEDDFEEDVIAIHTLANIDILSMDELIETSPDRDVLDPFAVSGLHMIDDDDVVELSDDVDEILDPLSANVFSLMDSQQVDDSALFVSTSLTLHELDSHTSVVDGDEDDAQPTSATALPGTPGNAPGDDATVAMTVGGSAQLALEVQQRLRVAMEGVGGRVELRMPWARYVAELRLETLSEPEAALRTLYMYVFASLLRLHGEPGVDAARLIEDAVQQVLAPFRPLLVQSLAAVWRAPMLEFKRQVEALVTFDMEQDVPSASSRHISIMVARVFEDILHGEPDESLLQQISESNSLLGMTAQALALHRAGDRMSASGYWQQIARYVDGEDRPVMFALAGHALRTHPKFCKRMLNIADEASSRLLWVMVQVEACKQGLFVQEAQALAYLIGILTEEQDEQSAQSRLDVLGAYYMRLASILRALQRSEVQQDGEELEAEESRYVLLRAVDHASDPVFYLRQLVRWCAQEGDDVLLGQTLEQLIHVYDDPVLSALVHEQLYRVRVAQDDDATGKQHIQRAVEIDPQCLPALIALGQSHLIDGDWKGVMQVRHAPAGRDASPLGPSWRRAELLERAGGDPKEVLSLYRNARHDHQDDVHLFWSVERALSVLGQWRGLRNLFETTFKERDGLTQALDARGYRVSSHLLAVETYLEDIQMPSIAVLDADYLQRQSQRQSRDDAPLVDEPLFWRLVTADMQARRIDSALERIEWAQTHIAPQSKEASVRVAMWHVYLVGWLLKKPESCLDSYRLLFEEAKSGMVRRFAFHGLLRLKDMQWLSQQLYLADGDTSDLVAIFGVPHEQRPLFGQAFSAELLHLGGQSQEATQRLSALASEQHDPEYKYMLQHRAMSLALSGRAWAQVQELLMASEPDDERQHQAFDALILQLNVCRDEPLPLDQLNVRQGALATSAPHALSELETCLRLRHWQRALEVIDLAIASTVDRHGRYRTFLTMLATIIAEWGIGQPEVAYEYARVWSSLAQEHGGEWEMLMMLGSWYRAAAALEKHEEAEKVLEAVHEHFDHSVPVLLRREVELELNHSPIKDVVEWYSRHVQKVQGAEQQYVYVCSVLLHWLFGDRTQKSAQYLADAHARDHDALQLLAYINVLAHRDVGMSASMERYLDGLMDEARMPELGAWSRIRGLFHLSITQNCLEEGLVQASTLSTIDAWLPEFQLLAQRALGTPESVEWASREELSGDARRVAQLESALIRADWAEIQELAEHAVPGAIVHMELRAAHERKDWCVQANLELQHMSLRRSLVNDAQDMVRRRFMNYIQHTDPAIIASPWCPLRLVEYEVSRLGLSGQELEDLLGFALRTHELGVGAEVRLIVSRQLMRAGRREDAVCLIPSQTGEDLVSLAWFWLVHALDPSLSHDDSKAHVLAAWQQRAMLCPEHLRGEVDYEIARATERLDEIDDAQVLYQAILREHPDFAPATIALSRLLIQRESWADLAMWWTSELESLKTDELRAAHAYKLGWLYDVRLADQDDAVEQAMAFYEQVLLFDGHHIYALHALLRLSYQSADYDRCVECLQAMIRASASRRIKTHYHLELAAVYENHLNLPMQALRHYQEAAQLMPSNADALLGALRVDDEESETSIKLLEASLERGADALPLMGDLLFVLAANNHRAEYVLSQRYPTHLVWRLTQLLNALERGELHEEALQLVRDRLKDEQVGMCFVLLNVAQLSARRQPGYLDTLSQLIQARPFAEGLYISTLSRALAERDMEALIAMGRVGAMRALDDAMRAAEWTRAAIFLRWSGEAKECLDVCTRLLDRVPDFLPAVKLARLVSAELPDWPALAMWSTREADLSRQPSIAVRARVEASEVQRRYLGDLDAAQNQLTMVLADNPQHEEAFENLKQILLQKQQINAVLKLCEQRLPNLKKPDRRMALLNEMSDLSMNSGQDPRRTIQYLNMSLKEEPRQLRRLRVLAELYDSLHQYEQAAMCYEAAIHLTQDARLGSRLWLQVAHIYEYKLSKPDAASRAYEKVLEQDPESTKALYALVRIYEQQNDIFHAMDTLERLASCAKTPEEIRRAKISRLELSLRGNIPNESVIRSANEVLVQYPDYRNAGKILGERLAQSGRAQDVDAVFRNALMESLHVHPHPPLQAFYQQAKRLYLSDLSFNIAAAARWRNLSNREMNQFHDNSQMRHKTPTSALPVELTAGVLPSDLSVSFFEIVRRSAAGILDSCDPVPYSQFTKRRFRLNQPANPAMQCAFQWPTLYGLELRDVYTADKLPLGSGVIFNGGDIRLVLDQSWRDVRNRDKLLVRLGTQLAAWSMGVGLWSSFGRDAQYALFVMTMRAVVPNWGPRQTKAKFPSWFHVDRYERWLQREGSNIIAPYVLDMSGRMGPAALPNQFVAVELAMERLGCVVMPDPYAFLPHTVRFGVDNGMHHRPWTFVFSPIAARLRQAIGVAYTT